MSDKDFEGPEAPFTVTLKGGGGFDAPWLVLRAASAEDAVALLGEAAANELLERIAEYAVSFQEKVSGGSSTPKEKETSSRSSGSSARSGGSSRGSRKPAQPEPAGDDEELEFHPEGLECDKRGCDGRVHYKKIKSGSGKVFELWVCEHQRSKGDGHFSEFIN